MGLFSKQLANVVEWEEFRDDMIFWKWTNREIKKGSRLIIRPGQDAIFMFNGRIEGIFTQDGSYDIESDIIPFLSTLKGFKFGFNSGMRAEVLFVNTKEFQIRWGTQNAVNIPTQGLPGGMPIRANGTLNFKVDSTDSGYINLIDQVAGVKEIYTVEDVRLRITAVLDQLLMKAISENGKDMFHLQSNASEIANSMKDDLNMEMIKIGLKVTGISVMSFNYPKEIQDMINKNASVSMVGDVGKYQQVTLTDGMANGNMKSGGTAADMAGMMMGMNIAKQMMDNMNGGSGSAGGSSSGSGSSDSGESLNFCPKCGRKLEPDAAFCPGCGKKLR